MGHMGIRLAIRDTCTNTHFVYVVCMCGVCVCLFICQTRQETGDREAFIVCLFVAEDQGASSCAWPQLFFSCSIASC